ncbi:MAG: methylornithine synthase PylB [Syntrophomonadaceae bacterium]|jgi:methylornithine synthase|nr:methylornithine synthase PylB [Syntrophomonadaceae bacterium]
MNLDEILKKIWARVELSRPEIEFLLNQRAPQNTDKIFAGARAMRKIFFGSKVFLYGFVYFSTYCRNDCLFCYYRKSNWQPPRYRKSLEQIVETAICLKNSGVHLIDLTMGEDAFYINHPEKLINIVKNVKDATGLTIMVSPGLVEAGLIDRLAAAGAEWLALYQETHNELLFNEIRINQDYQKRYQLKKYAQSQGMLVEEGILNGIGNDIMDIVDSLAVMKNLGAAQVRIMTFIPQSGTPMEYKANYGRDNSTPEFLTIAVMRLLFPHLLIPASLDIDGLKGLEKRLNSGANVITSIIPPGRGYNGVASAYSDIDEGLRTVEGIQRTLNKCGLEKASAEEYKEWVKSKKPRKRKEARI